jgi:hypothetical protein
VNEPLVWESTTPAYIRFVSARRYQAFRPYARKWYRPICPNCGPHAASCDEGRRQRRLPPLVSGAVGSEASETPLPPKSQSCVSTEPIVE